MNDVIYFRTGVMPVFYYKENHTLCVWSKKTFRDGEKKTSNDIIKVAGNRKNYNQRRTLNER